MQQILCLLSENCSYPGLVKFLDVDVHGSHKSGTEEACWAHNPEVGGSKPPSATMKIG